MSIPAIPGIYITYESSNILIGELGAPNSTLYPYPNPFNGLTTIVIKAPETTKVNLWVVRGYGPGETAEEVSANVLGADVAPQMGGSTYAQVEFVARAGRPIAIMSVNIRFSSEDGVPWPEGFYRIYVKVKGQKLQWGDVLFAMGPDSPYYKYLEGISSRRH